MQKGLLVVISGASGTGKGTVCKKLLAESEKIFYSISATTRQPRAGETDGVEYFFVTVDEFKNWINEDKFLEYAEVYGNFYGTPIHKIEERLNRGEDVLLEIDIQGALNVMKKRPDGVYIFLLPPSLEELKNRINNRGTESPEVLKVRLNAAKNEIAKITKPITRRAAGTIIIKITASIYDSKEFFDARILNSFKILDSINCD